MSLPWWKLHREIRPFDLRLPESLIETVSMKVHNMDFILQPIRSCKTIRTTNFVATQVICWTSATKMKLKEEAQKSNPKMTLENETQKKWWNTKLKIRNSQANCRCATLPSIAKQCGPNQTVWSLESDLLNLKFIWIQSTLAVNLAGSN